MARSRENFPETNPAITSRTCAMPKRCCSCCFMGQRKIARFSAFANYTGARPPRGASQSADARSGIGLALDSTCPETLSAFANYNCPLLLSPRQGLTKVPSQAVFT